MESEVLGLPTFQDDKHGFLQVSGISTKGDASGPTFVLFETLDGGRTWRPDRTIKNVNDRAMRKYGASVVVGSDWIFASTCDHQPRLNTLARGARIDASAEIARSRETCKDISHLVSFVSPTQGWIVVGDGDLMSTTDGGASWTRISPGPAPIRSSEDHSALESFEEHVFPGESSDEPNSQIVPMVPSAAPSGLGSVISKHLGFESQFTGTETEMRDWWSSSPFYDVGIYLNGADNHPIDSNLSALG
jgi:hypothetical protein